MLAKEDKNKYLRRAGLLALIVAVGACAGVASQSGSDGLAGNTPGVDDENDPDVYPDEDIGTTEEAVYTLGTSATSAATEVTDVKSFKQVKVGASKTVTLTYKNGGDQTLNMLTYIKQADDLFTVTDNCTGKTVAKKKTCTIKLKYTPTARSADYDTIVVKVAWNYTTTSDAGTTTTGVTSLSACSSSDDAGADSDAGTCTPNGSFVTFNATAKSTAYLYVWPTGTGSGSVNVAGKKCPTVCKNNVVVSSTDAGAKSVKLTATASNDSTFSGWSGGGCSGSEKTCTVYVGEDTKVTATFAKSYDASFSDDESSDAGSDSGSSDAGGGG